MFNTWKHNRDSYVVLPTEPPFNRPKNAKSRRLACNGCHDRKLRCTSEITGCSNCQKRGIECRYGAEVDGSSSRRPPEAQQQPVPTFESQIQSTAEGNLDKGDFGLPPLEDNLEHTDDSNALEPPIDLYEEDWLNFFTAFKSDDNSPLSSDSISSRRASSRSQSAVSKAMSTRNFTEHVLWSNSINRSNTVPRGYARHPSDYSILSMPFVPTSTFAVSESRMTPSAAETPFKSNRLSGCSCDITPLQTWEVLVTSIFSDKTTVEKLVECQEQTMSRCEAFLHCCACSSESQGILLVLDIVAKLLDSLKVQYGGLKNGNISDDSIDNGIKHEWMGRVLRLGRLIASLASELEGQEWLPHRSLLQSVQVQFPGLMFGW